MKNDLVCQLNFGRRIKHGDGFVNIFDEGRNAAWAFSLEGKRKRGTIRKGKEGI
jgi:hypothetical protein